MKTNATKCLLKLQSSIFLEKITKIEPIITITNPTTNVKRLKPNNDPNKYDKKQENITLIRK